jgi:hypothetical protein
MAPSHREPDFDDLDGGWDPESSDAELEPRWRPDPPWEPEPEPTPWSERESEPDAEPDWERSAPREDRSPVAPVDAPRGGYGPAYLAAAALLVVLFAMGLLTVGLHGAGHWARATLAAGSALLLLGLALLGLATWLVGGLERG